MAIKRALVVSGGGAKGAFAAGAIKYLMVEKGIAFDLVVGTSTGALIAPFVATADVADLLAIYENVEDQDILADRPDLLAFLFSDALNDSAPLEGLINRFFGGRGRYERLVSSPVEAFVTVVNLQTGEVEYGNQHQDGRKDFLRKVLASASVPVMMPPVKIGRHQYVDGGVKDLAPLGKAIDEGATHIVSIILSPDEDHREPVKGQFTSTADILKRTLDLLTEEVVDNDVKIANLYTAGVMTLGTIQRNAREILGLTPSQMKALFSGLGDPFEDKKIVGITVIRPDQELAALSLSFDPVKMREMVDEGRLKAKEVVKREIEENTGFF